MATAKEAAVRLTLNGGNYTTAIKAVGDETARQAKRSKDAWSSVSAGLGQVKKDFGELGGQIKGLASAAISLGGALSISGAALSAQGLISTYKDLAFAIEAGTGKATNWRAVQGDIEATANRWGRSNGEVAQSFKELWDETGDADFARAAIEQVAKAATATGQSVTALTGIAGTLNEKFGVTADQLPDALALTVSLANKGGASAEQMGEKLGLLGAAAKEVGLKGQAGFQQVAAMLNQADNATGSFKKSIGAVTGLLDTLADPDKLKGVEKALGGLALHDKGGGAKTDAIDRILSKTRGNREQLAKAFSGDTLKLVTQYGQEFAAKFASTEGTVKQKTAAALAAYHAALADAGRSTLSAARLSDEAAKRVDEPKRRLEAAINKVTAAFERPEIVNAINVLAESLPKLADMIAGVVGFTAEHPAAAAGVALGGKAALSFGTGMIGDAAKQFAAGAFGTAAKGGKEAGDALAKTAAPQLGSIAGKAFGVAAAFAIGYELTTNFLDFFDKLNSREGAMTQAGNAELGANRATGQYAASEDKQAAIAKLDQAIAQGEKTNKGGALESLYEGAGDLTDALGLTKPKQSAREIQSQQLDRLKGLRDQLQGELAAPAAAPGATPGAPAAAAAEPRAVEVKGQERLAQTLARGIADRELRVRIVNMPQGGIGGDAARGPSSPPQPQPSGGTGGG